MPNATRLEIRYTFQSLRILIDLPGRNRESSHRIIDYSKQCPLGTETRASESATDLGEFGTKRVGTYHQRAVPLRSLGGRDVYEGKGY
jgi:hypothetical protein